MTEFTADIEQLREVLRNAGSIFDENTSESLKGVVFRVDDGFVDIASYGYIISYYKRIQVKSSSGRGMFFVPVMLNNVIESLQNTALTRITDVTIVEEEKHVRLLATEIGVEETQYSGFTQRLVYYIPKMKLNCNDKLDFTIIEKGVEENSEHLPVEDFKLVANMFLPLFGKNDFRAQRSYLFLGEKLFMINAFMVAYCNNIFNIKDKSINSKLLAILKIVVNESQEGFINLWEKDKRIMFEYNGNYVTYNIPRVESLSIDHVLEPATEQRGILISTEMLLALFKRSAALSDKFWEMEITETSINILNKSINMRIPIHKNKGLTGKYIVEIEHLDKALVLRQANYLLLYVYETQHNTSSGVRLKIKDDTKMWACDIPIKIKK